MKKIYNRSSGVQSFLDQRDYLLANSHMWINGKDEEVAMTSMDATYQLNCMNWLNICLEELSLEDESTNDVIRPLVVSKMEEFIELFPISLKRETSKLKEEIKKKYNKIIKEYNELR